MHSMPLHALSHECIAEHIAFRPLVLNSGAINQPINKCVTDVKQSTQEGQGCFACVRVYSLKALICYTAKQNHER